MADTSVTAQTVIDNSLARLKDPDKTQWTDVKMLNLINKGIALIHQALIRDGSELAVSFDTITMLADTQEYALSGNLDNFWSIVKNGVFFAGSDPMTPITVEDAKRESSTTTDTAPLFFYLTGTHLGVANIPTATSVAAYPTLTCRYFAKEAALELTDAMPYKNLFNEAISAFASSLAIMKTEAPLQEYMALYNALEASALEIAHGRSAL